MSGKHQAGRRRYPRGGVHRPGLPVDPWRRDRVQQRPLLKVLATLEGRATCRRRWSSCAALRFLRYAEHAIQALADRQTQMLPSDDYDRIRVAFIMGFASWAAFHERLATGGAHRPSTSAR